MFVKATESPKVLRELATGLGIVWVGKSNDDLAAEINEKMKARLSGEAQPTMEEKVEVVEEAIGEETVEEIMEEAETPQAAEEVIESVVEEVVEEVVEQPQLTVVPKEETTETPKTVRTTGKWYEQDGAFPYQAGQKIEITEMENTKHSFLNGREAVIVGPSTKKNAVKAQLVNPKNGKLQKTECTFNYSEIKLVEEKVEQEVM